MAVSFSSTNNIYRKTVNNKNNDWINHLGDPGVP
jgi:hypothetical protein